VLIMPPLDKWEKKKTRPALMARSGDIISDDDRIYETEGIKEG